MVDESTERVHLQAILTILRHLGRLSEVRHITITANRLHILLKCMISMLHVRTTDSHFACSQLHCQMDEGKFENVYILI